MRPMSLAKRVAILEYVIAQLAEQAGVAIPSTTEAEDDGFEAAWAVFPERAGGNSKTAAAKAYRARLRAGATPEALLDATLRYAAYCKADGRVGTEFVLMGSTFYGPNGRWQDEWRGKGPVDPDLDELLATVRMARED